MDNKKEKKPDETNTIDFNITNKLMRILISKLSKPLKTDKLRNTGIRTSQSSINNTSPNMIAMENEDRKRIVVRNIGTKNCYIGEAGVTTANGFLIKATESISLQESWGALYGISDDVAGTTMCMVEE